MKKELFIVATANKNKLIEIKQIMKDLPFEIRSMAEMGIDEEILETGQSFEENALIKAQAVHQKTGGYVMADDSGLAIDALQGAPGIYSARFCGENASYGEKFAEIWKLLADVPLPKRTAQFVCAIAVVRPDGSHFVVKGLLEGLIWHQDQGEKGFGYDPIFYLPDWQKTTAELEPEVKNAISHRAKALQLMLANLS